ncbi:hypothetical protein RI054_33g130130 [Pseudoscourfieldia marina]
MMSRHHHHENQTSSAPRDARDNASFLLKSGDNCTQEEGLTTSSLECPCGDSTQAVRHLAFASKQNDTNDNNSLKKDRNEEEHLNLSLSSMSIATPPRLSETPSPTPSTAPPNSANHEFKINAPAQPTTTTTTTTTTTSSAEESPAAALCETPRSSDDSTTTTPPTALLPMQAASDRTYAVENAPRKAINCRSRLTDEIKQSQTSIVRNLLRDMNAVAPTTTTPTKSPATNT